MDSTPTISQVSLSAIVLAGGQSTRMGRDKALIKISGVPLLRRVCEAALHCTNQIYVVTAWSDRYRAVVPPHCHLIVDIQQGPLVGFAQGLTYIQTDWVLLLACDLPRLRGETLQSWTAELETISPDTIALLPHSQKGWEPLCGFYRRQCLSELQQFIDQGGRSFQSWLANQQVQELRLENREILFNCNTPQDLEDFSRDNR
ncbi:molybdenum cofactor guanylyltransferase [Phormidesmis priestleyi ULC007]|uniref:Probable molybdenum cofactor guanylyltransferase n=1 Tax=Phormidesmis priestleyi ULC007 TaxID=1920490 RepID=A0A2T1DC20_9CYAN|nr:molybdenum cofactor guanylyltransferase [Phormidesmis priestleyi]PSB18007.1 molybdenum cofactor guanylyltransferase [Phormidesmis priestleyi ULC007]PZO49347.1 MAG: molybdenum cofactor guanylyltransferase [Phormidesmis priestleyi]